MDIQNILLNSIYAGVGPYPAIVPEETFLAAAARLIEEMGAERYVAQVRSLLIEQNLAVPPGLPAAGEPRELAGRVLDAIRKANPA